MGSAVGLLTGNEGEGDGERDANHRPTAALLRDMAYKNSLRWRHTHTHTLAVMSTQHQVIVLFWSQQERGRRTPSQCNYLALGINSGED